MAHSEAPLFVGVRAPYLLRLQHGSVRNCLVQPADGCTQMSRCPSGFSNSNRKKHVYCSVHLRDVMTRLTHTGQNDVAMRVDPILQRREYL
uniref:C2H2-type domain-containing protein n=1 Tax=Knipowitschia caucasica TaxID=637954 RepID=A0AAV2KLE7_KNICA